MHDAIIAIVFIAMLLAPCISAAITGGASNEKSA